MKWPKVIAGRLVEWSKHMVYCLRAKNQSNDTWETWDLWTHKLSHVPLAAHASAFCWSWRSILWPSSSFLKWCTLFMTKTRGLFRFRTQRKATFSNLFKANASLDTFETFYCGANLFQCRDVVHLLSFNSCITLCRMTIPSLGSLLWNKPVWESSKYS